jgi:hypothetical protein
MSEDNFDRKPFIPNAPTREWGVAFYIEESATIVVGWIMGRTWLYRFLLITLFVFPLMMGIFVLSLYFKNKVEENRIDNAMINIRKKEDFER